MYFILTTASHDDMERDALPQATDPAIFDRLTNERDVAVPLQQPLTLLISPLSLQKYSSLKRRYSFSRRYPTFQGVPENTGNELGFTDKEWIHRKYG
ncbi:MAG: hypothetical protein ACYDER_03625 [Ktedonobacteraceae bacterium]